MFGVYYIEVLGQLYLYINRECFRCGSEMKKNGKYSYNGCNLQRLRCKECGFGIKIATVGEILKQLKDLGFIGFDRSFLNNLRENQSRKINRRIEKITQNQSIREVPSPRAYYNKDYYIRISSG